MKKPIALAISTSLTLLAACNQQSSDVEPNEAGSRTLPEYYSKPTNKTPDRTLACMLRELSLQASNNSFDHSSNGSTWSIKDEELILSPGRTPSDYPLSNDERIELEAEFKMMTFDELNKLRLHQEDVAMRCMFVQGSEAAQEQTLASQRKVLVEKYLQEHYPAELKSWWENLDMNSI